MAFDRRAHVETRDINTNIQTANSYNIIPRVNQIEATSNGITRSAIDGVWSFNGTATSTYFYRLINGQSKLPDWWIPGKKYRLYANIPQTSDLWLAIFVFDESHPSGTEFLLVKNGGVEFEVPSGYTGVQVRWEVYKDGVCDNLTGITAVLSEIASNAELEFALKSNGMSSHFNSPMISIIDDDGNPKFLTELVPLMQSKKIPIATAVIGQRVAESEDGTNPERSMNWNQIKEAFAAGAEVLSHSYSHWGEATSETKTVGELVEDYLKSKNAIALHGIDTADILVYPGAAGNVDNVLEATARVFKCGIRSSGNVVNFFGETNRYAIKRFRLETEYQYDIELIKPIVDNLIKTGGWAIWMIHTSQNWDANSLSVVSQAIDYALSKNVPIVPVHYGAKKYFGI